MYSRNSMKKLLILPFIFIFSTLVSNQLNAQEVQQGDITHKQMR